MCYNQCRPSREVLGHNDLSFLQWLFETWAMAIFNHRYHFSGLSAALHYIREHIIARYLLLSGIPLPCAVTPRGSIHVPRISPYHIFALWASRRTVSAHEPMISSHVPSSPTSKHKPHAPNSRSAATITSTVDTRQCFAVPMKKSFVHSVKLNESCGQALYTVSHSFIYPSYRRALHEFTRLPAIK